MVEKLKGLSPAAQKEVENFIDFKRGQEQDVWTEEGESGGDDE